MEGTKLTLTSAGALGVWMEQQKDRVRLPFQYGGQATVRTFWEAGWEVRVSLWAFIYVGADTGVL